MHIRTPASFIFSPFANPDQVLKAAAEKMKLNLIPTSMPVPNLHVEMPPPIQSLHQVRPLVRPPVVNPTAVPIVVTPLPVPRIVNTPVAPPVAPLVVNPPVTPPAQDNGIFDRLLNSVVPSVKTAVELLKNQPRIQAALLVIGMLGVAYMTKGTTIRNVDIAVEADANQERTYDFKLGKGDRVTTIQLVLKPGEPMGIHLSRPKTTVPTVYNIEVLSPVAKTRQNIEVFDLGHKQVVRVVR